MRTRWMKNGGRDGGRLAVALIAALSAWGCTPADTFNRNSPETTRIRCNVTRQECAQVDMASGTCVTTREDSATFTGDFCVQPSSQANAMMLCQQKFCTSDINAPGTCTINSATFADQNPECTLLTSPSGQIQLANVALHSVHPDIEHGPVSGTTKTFNTIREDPNPFNSCMPSGLRPITWVGPPDGDYSGAVSIGSVNPGSACDPNASFALFSLVPPPTPVATATGGGITTTMTALRGQARIGESCFGEICVLQSLDDFQADISDMTISGVQLRKLRVNSIKSAPLTQISLPDENPFLGVAPGELRLRVEGQVNGVDSQFHVASASPFRVDGATSFRLLGSFLLDGLGPNGTSLPITIAVNATGPTATPQQLACATQSQLSRLFGFEDVQSWTSTQGTLSLVTSPVRQGCGALGVSGQGYMPIVGAPFTTRGLATNAALSVDLFIPTGQPNPSWLGALQMYLSCPSGAVSNQYIGQVELTGKPVCQYSTLRFPLPSVTLSTLARPLDDCFFSFALNVNATGNTWLLDRLRFTP